MATPAEVARADQIIAAGGEMIGGLVDEHRQMLEIGIPDASAMAVLMQTRLRRLSHAELAALLTLAVHRLAGRRA